MTIKQNVTSGRGGNSTTTTGGQPSERAKPVLPFKPYISMYILQTVLHAFYLVNVFFFLVFSTPPPSFVKYPSNKVSRYVCKTSRLRYTDRLDITACHCSNIYVFHRLIEYKSHQQPLLSDLVFVFPFFVDLFVIFVKKRGKQGSWA